MEDKPDTQKYWKSDDAAWGAPENRHPTAGGVFILLATWSGHTKKPDSGYHIYLCLEDNGLSGIPLLGLREKEWSARGIYSFDFKRHAGSYHYRYFRGAQSGPRMASKTGCVCKRCHSLNQYAAANQKDGSYVCYECR